MALLAFAGLIVAILNDWFGWWKISNADLQVTLLAVLFLVVALIERPRG